MRRNIIGRDYQRALQRAIENGVDFEADFHEQSKGEFLSELARGFGYRKPKTANGSTGRYFFNLLKRLHDKRKQ